MKLVQYRNGFYYSLFFGLLFGFLNEVSAQTFTSSNLPIVIITTDNYPSLYAQKR